MTQANFYRIAILVLAILCLYQWQCTGGKSCPVYTETVKIDTVYVPVKDTSTVKRDPVAKSEKKPKIQDIKEPLFIVENTEHTGVAFDPDWIANGKIDTAAIVAAYMPTVQDWATERRYAETYPTQYGNVTVYDTIQYNNLKRQKVITNFSIPVVNKETVKVEKSRGKIFIGIDGVGNEQNFFQGGGGSLMYQSPGGKGYEAGVLFLNGEKIYRVSFKQLISFRKK